MGLLADRVSETSSTTGTGQVINLAGPESGHQSFVAAGFAGKTRPYVIIDGTAWEVGRGVITDASPDTLSRDEVFASTNGNARISLTGAARVFQSVSGFVFNERVIEEEVTTTDATQTAVHSFALADNTAYFIDVILLARRTDVAGRAFFGRRCLAYRESAGNATIEEAVDTYLTIPSTTSYSAILQSDGANAIDVLVTGAAGHTVNWGMAVVSFSKIS